MEAEQKAQVDPDKSWSEPERWAWAEIRAGKIADFHARHSELNPKEPKLDPKEPGGWDQTRKLSQAFLETILVDEPFKGAVPRQGVRIVGAWFEEPIDLDNSQIVPQLWLDQCRFERTVDFSSATLSSNLSFEGSRLPEANLSLAKVCGQVNMIGSTFTGTLDMNGLQVDGSLLMSDRARFAEVVLVGTRVGGQLSMDGYTIAGKIKNDSIDEDGSL